MSIINSFFIALSMYSRIPVPRVDWEKENMRYAMCFFPMIGVVIGAVIWQAGCWIRRLWAVCSVVWYLP